MKNTYLEQVQQQKVQVEDDLRVKRSASTPAGAPRGGQAREESASGVRVTGFWRFKNVIVPPNVYVVHTRRGRKDPVTMGLGTSFKFDPVTDSYLVVPAATQTIMLQANCISKERQGLVVQGYVQWIINDIGIAYKKLDFSDAIDPMRVVNAQLREQAEAAIKDKVTTMSIDEVLADKQPIIRELTARVGSLAEADLGLRIVTMQIKEAVVSSPTVWEMLQRPFRSERGKEARLSEIAAQTTIDQRVNQAEGEKFTREQEERARRAKIEADSLAQSLAFEQKRSELQAQMKRLALEQAILETKLTIEREKLLSDAALSVEREKLKLENDVTPQALQGRLVRMLPTVAEKLPKPTESKTIHLNGSTDLAQMVQGVLSALKS